MVLLDEPELDRTGATQVRTLAREAYQRWLDDEYLISDLWLKQPVDAIPRPNTGH